MRTSHLLINLILVLALSASPAAPAQGGSAGPYHYLKTIQVGGEGGWDYGAIDPAGRRLYWSHATKVVVVDIDKDTVVGEIADTPGVHGIAIAPELGLAFTSNGRENKAGIIDLKSLATNKKVETGANPDAILYDPDRREVYTFNGRGNSATVFEAHSGKVIATIPLGGKPEFAQIDVKTGRIYANLEDKSEVAVIDTASHDVVAHWPIAPGGGPSGMAIDAARHRLFLGAEKLMVVLDYLSGKVVTTIPIGPGVDANAFDSGSRLAFASCGGDGTVTIAREENGKADVLQVLRTARGARTMALDPRTHRIYLATADYGNSITSQPAAPGQRPLRPPMIPGSFKILVYGTDER